MKNTMNVPENSSNVVCHIYHGARCHMYRSIPKKTDTPLCQQCLQRIQRYLRLVLIFVLVLATGIGGWVTYAQTRLGELEQASWVHNFQLLDFNSFCASYRTADCLKRDTGLACLFWKAS